MPFVLVDKKLNTFGKPLYKNADKRRNTVSIYGAREEPQNNINCIMAQVRLMSRHTNTSVLVTLDDKMPVRLQIDNDDEEIWVSSDARWVVWCVVEEHRAVKEPSPCPLAPAPAQGEDG